MSKTAGEGFQSLSILHSLPNVFFEFEGISFVQWDLCTSSLRKLLQRTSLRISLKCVTAYNTLDADTVMDVVECYSGCQSFILFADLELRIAIGLSGLQGPVRDKERREKKRSELHDLVGKNLHVLRQIEGVDLDMYRDTVLPNLGVGCQL
ncbi:hypothetical protein ACSBR2_017264 [Camellia fascicularis]